MLLAALLVLSAVPSTTVIVTRRTQVSLAEGRALAEQVAHALKEAGLVVTEPADAARRLSSLGVKDTTVCQGRKQCIVEFGKQLGVDSVVSLSLSQFEGERSMALDTWAISSEAIVHRAEALFRAAPSPQDLADFADRTRAALTALAAPPAAAAPDAPRTTPLVPVELPPPPPPVVVDTPERSHTPALVVGGVGAAALIAAGVLTTTGLMAKARVDETLPGNKSNLTESAARATAATANTQLTAAGIAALAGAGLGATAIILW